MNIEQTLERSLKLVFGMEYYGIRMEDAKEVGDMTYYYISVPESSTIEIDDPEINTRIKTSDGLSKFARDMFIEMQIESCKVIDEDEDWIQYVKDNMADFIKVFAKVRKGEI